MVLMSYLEPVGKSKIRESFCCVFQEFSGLVLLLRLLICFWMWLEVRVQFHTFAFGYLISQHCFWENSTIWSLLLIGCYSCRCVPWWDLEVGLAGPELCRWLVRTRTGSRDSDGSAGLGQGTFTPGLFCVSGFVEFRRTNSTVYSSALWETGFWSSAFLTVWLAEQHVGNALGGRNSGVGVDPRRGNSGGTLPPIWPCRPLTPQNSSTAGRAEPWFFGVCGCGLSYTACFLSLCPFCCVLGRTRPGDLVCMAESEHWMRI